jgi:hypothetical protein
MNITRPSAPTQQELRWVPQQVREGVFGAQIDDGLYAFLELLTPENENYWGQFKEMNNWVANSRSRGVLSVILRQCYQGTPWPSYSEVEKETGFTSEEYEKFKEDAKIAIRNTQGKIVDVIERNCHGSQHMCTYAFSGQANYIAYITSNKDFSIKNCNFPQVSRSLSSENADPNGVEMSLKNYIKLYSDVLITVGVNLTGETFHNRGISSNPWLAFLNAVNPHRRKFGGFSMILQGLTGAVVAKFFSAKMTMQVKPIGSMQAILSAALRPGDGYIEKSGQQIDLTTLKVSPDNPEGSMNYIKTSALTRIYYGTLAKQNVKKIMTAQLLAGARL